jgi:hypothetical protein
MILKIGEQLMMKQIELVRDLPGVTVRLVSSVID